MATRPNILQNLNQMMMGNSVPTIYQKNGGDGLMTPNTVLYSTDSKEDFDAQNLKMKQQKLLSYQWVKAGADSAMESLAGQNAVKLMYRDCDLMETFPEIGAALDIYAEEACLGGDTKIKLLNGEVHTIEELYQGNYTDFWCYAVNEKGECAPTHIERVSNKGEKEVYELTLDDGSVIECTPDHLWLLSDNTWKKTEDLAFGDSLMSIYDEDKVGEIKIKIIVKAHKQTQVYDLVNSSTNSCFGVKCNEGHIISHNCNINSKGKMLNIYSKSPRIKAVLEDLFINRLQINTTLPMICRSMCKYGNEYQLLNIDLDNGIRGWRRIIPYEVDRIENGYTTSSAAANMTLSTTNLKPDEVQFIWLGHNESMPYKEWNVAHFRMLQDSFFLPYGCIVGDSRIETENGYKEIKNIEIGDRVVTFNINTQEKEIADVTMAMPKGVKPVFRVATTHNEIEGTDDHKLLCYEDNELVYKEIKDIQVGDLLVIDNSFNKQNSKIAIDKSFPNENECSLINHNKSWWNDNIDFIPDFVDEKFARFFGFMIGDGWITGNHVYFATGVYDSLNKEFGDYLQQISGQKLKYRKESNRCLEISQIWVNSLMLKIILRRMGFEGKFNTKRVPSWVYSSSDSIKKAFLNGLMIADGSYNIDKYNVLRCNIEMSNEQLIKDIKTLVQSLGYKSSKVSYRNRVGKEIDLKNGRKIITKYPSYYLYFYESLNAQDKKYDLINRKNFGFKTEKVKGIEYAGEKETYDITVSNENSNFFANGIVTHNCSLLHKARRAWRMLSMMEDAMLIYRLDKSVERRVFKIFVGAIDDADVPGYVQEIANNFKRTPIIDPQTGQIDLRKNFMDVSTDYFIPVRREDAPNPIETLQAAQNPTAMDDIQYMQNKIFAALRIPKTFLNYQEAQGKGQNLSLLDIRFCRMVNKIQQYLLLELNKIACVHLYLLGFHDDLNNFTLSMNNPSAQIEALELEDLTKRIQTAATALADPGIGMPIFSLHRVLKEIMKMSDKEIKDMLNEIRLEKAMSAELALTAQVIKKTGIFDAVDNIYGDFDSGKAPAQQQQDPNQMGGPGGAGGGAMGGGDIGDSLHMDSLGGPGEDTSSDIGGETTEVPMSQAPNVDPSSLNESSKHIKELGKSFIKQYFDMLTEGQKIEEDDVEVPVDYVGKNYLLEQNMKKGLDVLNTATDKISENCDILEEELDKIKDTREIISLLEE